MSLVLQGGSGGLLRRGWRQWDSRPLYPEDATAILSLEEALIKGGMTANPAKQYASSLLGYGRWLFAKNKPSIVTRVDGESLTDGGDLHEFGKSDRLLKSLEHLRTFRRRGSSCPSCVRGALAPS